MAHTPAAAQTALKSSTDDSESAESDNHLSNDNSGQSIYDLALERVNRGIAVAIVPTETQDGELAGVYALTVDLSVRDDLRSAFYEQSAASRAGSAIGLLFVAKSSCEDAGLNLRRVPHLHSADE